MVSLLSCSKETIIVPAKEPGVTNTEGVLPENFSISVEEITDCSIYLKWYPVKNADSYDIMINDTLVIYDIGKSDYLGYFYFHLTNLDADTEYKLAVRAKNEDLNVTISYLITRTLKTFIDFIIQISLNKYEYEFVGCSDGVNTDDGGILLVQRVYRYGEEQFLFFKLDKYYNIEWINKSDFTKWDVWNSAIINCKDGGFFIVNEYAITRIDKQGTTLWTTEISLKYDDYFKSAAELPNGDFVIVGNSFDDKSCIAKISSSGQLMFKKYMGENVKHILEQVIAKDDGNLLICGLNGSYDSYNPQAQSVVALECDDDGNILNMNEINTGIPASLITGLYLLEDGNFYITGGCSEGTSYGNRNSLIKIDPRGNMIWSKKYDHGGGGLSPYIVTAFPNSDGSCLLLVSDDRGVGFLKIASDGDVLHHRACYGYTYGMVLKQIDDNKCMYVSTGTTGTNLIFINLDGYKTSY